MSPHSHSSHHHHHHHHTTTTTSSHSSNQFAKFQPQSSLSSIPHDPFITLASNCIRDYFGPTVQIVADALMARGDDSTITQLITYIELKTQHKVQKRSKERDRIIRITKLRPVSIELGEGSNASIATDNDNCPSTHASVRASLLVLVQHSIVKVKQTAIPVKLVSFSNRNNNTTASKRTVYTYSIDIHRARLIQRYPKYIEYTSKAFDTTTSILVEEILVYGRLTLAAAIRKTVEHLHKVEAGKRKQKKVSKKKDRDKTIAIVEASKETSIQESSPKPIEVSSGPNISTDTVDDDDHEHHHYKTVLESFWKLIRSGFLLRVSDLKDTMSPLDDEEEEIKFDDNPPTKKQKLDPDDVRSSINGVDTGEKDNNTAGCKSKEHGIIVSLLVKEPYQSLSADFVYTINIPMIHEQLRAISLGWLVAELHGHKIQSSGSLISAALKLEAARRYSVTTAKSYEMVHYFTIPQIKRYLPKPILQNFEKKKDSTTGSGSGIATRNIYNALMELSQLQSPKIVNEVKTTPGHPDRAQFQINKIELIKYLRDRISHQIILDSHGEVAARICSILRTKGFLESDTIAELAMAPAKDTREVLHHLYRHNYIELFNINQGKQHNPSSMIYLWGFLRTRSIRNIADNVGTALCNVRLRRQHEVEVGKDYIDRAKEAGATDENENEADKVSFKKFCKGLERLDSAAIQLDETLMALKDY